MTLRLPIAAALLVTTATVTGATAAEPGKPAISAQTSMSGGPLDPVQKKLRLDTVDLAIEVDPEREVINATATLRMTTLARTDRVVVDLDKNYTVTAVQIDGVDAASYANPDGRMSIRLVKRVAANTALAIKIVYGGRPHAAVRAPWDGGMVWAKTPDGRPWMASAIQMEGCDLLWPCIDYPTYEPEKIDLHITVPKGLKAPANGKLLGVEMLPDGRSIWNWQARNPTLYSVSLSVGPYEQISGTHKSRFGNDIPMFYWYLPGPDARAREKAEKLCAEFAPTLDFLEATLGPYPFADEKLGVVQTPYQGMEHQTINAYGNDYAKTPWGFDDLFQHEFSHEWFANQLTAANWDDFWLHEGFGQYMQPLYSRWRGGEFAYHAAMNQNRAQILNKAPMVSGSPKASEEVYDAATGPGQDIYYKGAWMLHTLREHIGDKAFFEATRRLVYGRPDPRPGNFKPRYSSSAEFRRIVNQVTGRDYGWLFDVYLEEAALPELVEERRGETLQLRWKTPGNKPFPLPVEVEVDGRVQTVAMAGNKGSLAVPFGAHVVLDPSGKILRRSADIEAFQAWQKEQAAKAPAAAK